MKEPLVDFFDGIVMGRAFGGGIVSTRYHIIMLVVVNGVVDVLNTLWFLHYGGAGPDTVKVSE